MFFGFFVPGQNLVVCPLSVLYNWSEQLKLHAPSLKVRTYHGADRDLPLNSKICRILSLGMMGVKTSWDVGSDWFGNWFHDLFFRSIPWRGVDFWYRFKDTAPSYSQMWHQEIDLLRAFHSMMWRWPHTMLGCHCGDGMGMDDDERLMMMMMRGLKMNGISEDDDSWPLYWLARCSLQSSSRDDVTLLLVNHTHFFHMEHGTEKWATSNSGFFLWKSSCFPLWLRCSIVTFPPFQQSPGQTLPTQLNSFSVSSGSIFL